jgi:hypothetical protein
MDFVKPPRWSKAEADQRLLVALHLQIENWLMTEMGQKRRFDPLPATSGLPRTTDIIRSARLVRFVPQPDIGVHQGANCSSNALASFRSSVSNPSVNQL